MTHVCSSVGDTQLSYSHTWGQLRVTNRHVCGLWEEAGAPGETPRGHGDNMQTPHRKPLGFRAQDLLCEATLSRSINEDSNDSGP